MESFVIVNFYQKLSALKTCVCTLVVTFKTSQYLTRLIYCLYLLHNSIIAILSVVHCVQAIICYLIMMAVNYGQRFVKRFSLVCNSVVRRLPVPSLCGVRATDNRQTAER